MNKLILEEIDMPEKLDLEDFNRRKELHESKKLKEDVPSEETMMAINSMIRNLIQDQWSAIDVLNGTQAAMQQHERADIMAILSDMINDNYIHIGQLEKLLQIGDSGASQIDAGKEDIEDDMVPADHLEDEVVEVDPVETEALEEQKGFLKNYKSGSIHDAGDCYVATDEHGKTLGSSKTVAGAESFIDELPEDDVPADLVDEIDFKKEEEE